MGYALGAERMICLGICGPGLRSVVFCEIETRVKGVTYCAVIASRKGVCALSSSAAIIARMIVHIMPIRVHVPETLFCSRLGFPALRVSEYFAA